MPLSYGPSPLLLFILRADFTEAGLELVALLPKPFSQVKMTDLPQEPGYLSALSCVRFSACALCCTASPFMGIYRSQNSCDVGLHRA